MARVAGAHVSIALWLAVVDARGGTIAATLDRDPLRNLGAGNELGARLVGDAALLDAHASGGPIQLASADLDGDGKADVIACYETEDAGALALWLGKDTSVATVVALSERPDMLAAADVNGDGHADVIAVARGGRRMHVLAGDGRGTVRRWGVVELPGEATALAAADVDRVDGHVDLLVGVRGADGAALAIYEGPSGAARATPERVPLPGDVTAIVAGQLDQDVFPDVAVAAGGALHVVHGRDRKITLPEEAARVAAPRVDRIGFLEPVAALACADFWGDVRPDLALLTVAGDVHVLERADAASQSPRFAGRLLARDASANPLAARIVPARLLLEAHADVLVVDEDARRLVVLQSGAREAATLALERGPAAALVVRLNDDPWDDLVVAHRGARAPVAFRSRTRAIFTVSNGADSGAGSLRQAILDANAAPGGDTINFSFPGPAPFVVAPTAALPAITSPVILDGTSQPGYVASPIVEIDGTAAGAGVNGITITATLCQIRGLVIRNFTGHGLRIAGSGANVVEENYIGLDVAGAADRGNGLSGIFIDGSPNNFVAGTTVDRPNVVSGNDGYGILIQGAGATSNLIQNNQIGITALGTAAVANSLGGVRVETGSNTIGGSTGLPGSAPGNVIAGNSGSGVSIAGVSGTLVQGNRIGVDVNSVARPNAAAGVLLTGAATTTTIGGSTVDLRNVISGNGTHGVEVSGASATGNLVQGNFIGTGANGTSDVGNTLDGVRFTGTGTNTVGGAPSGNPGTPPGNVISGNSGNGVALAGGTSACIVLGNTIGLTTAGNAPLSNSANGVLIDVSGGNTIGGTTTAERNLISGNTSDGIEISGAAATGNFVRGNYIGPSITGLVDVGNGGNGVLVTNAPGNTIGGDTSTPGNAPGNYVSANNTHGIALLNSGTTSTVVAGNVIGLNAGGTSALGNTLNGIYIDGASGNTIGGDTVPQRNVISRNGCTPTCSGTSANGIQLTGNNITGNVIKGNFIGLSINGANAMGNQANGIFFNGSGSGSFTVGGATATPGTPPGNFISGNVSDGIELGASASGIVITGNVIGLGATGLDRGNTAHGINLNQAASTAIGGATVDLKNVISGNDGSGIVITSASGTNIRNNAIGTSADGASDLGNGGSGIEGTSASNTVIGGSASTPGASPGNVISGNTGRGISITSGSTLTIQGNVIGTNAAGAAALANSGGGVRTGTTTTTIGGDVAAQRNLISGNGLVGLEISGGTATIKNNYIGTDVGGTADLGNSNDGVLVTVNGITVGPGNVISGNNGDGIQLGTPAGNSCVVTGNLIGTDVTGTLDRGNGGDGVFIQSNGCTVGPSNVISGNGDDGVTVGSGVATSFTGTLVIGNLIGTDVGGTLDLGNTGSGVELNRSIDAIVGGTTAAERNVLSGNSLAGVTIDSLGQAATGNVVRGNYIGTNAAGTAVIPGNAQSNGVLLGGVATGNTIGGTAAGARNVISGNRRGILQSNSAAVTIQGNYIGVDVSGSSPLGNVDVGVTLGGSNAVVGGPGAGEGNVIAFNGPLGGVLVDPSTSTGHVIRGNSTYGNGGLGIDLSVSLFPPDGVTLNDALDPDTGSNSLQNFPVLTSVTYNAGTDTTNILGTLNSTANTSFSIDFYSNTSADLTGFGEGRTYVGSTAVLTNASGDASFNVTVFGNATSFTTATATGLSGTSEFSAILSNPKEASPAGNLLVTKGAGTSVNLLYTAACGATSHTAFWGSTPIAGALQWTNAACLLGASGGASFDPGTPAPGETFYFVLVGQNGTKEGSYGRNSSGVERPEAIGIGACDRTRVLTGTCP